MTAKTTYVRITYYGKELDCELEDGELAKVELMVGKYGVVPVDDITEFIRCISMTTFEDIEDVCTNAILERGYE